MIILLLVLFRIAVWAFSAGWPSLDDLKLWLRQPVAFLDNQFLFFGIWIVMAWGLAIGITGYFYRQFLAENLPPGPGTFPLMPIPGLADIPVIGPIFFVQKPLTYILFISVFFLHYTLFYTPWGLRTRAVGEHPRAADTLGVNVNRMRYINTLAGGLLAGLGGAWFTLEAVDVFNPGMTNGLGFIGLAAMIFGKWNPFGALLGALIFGLGNSITSTVSIFRPDIPSHIPQMLPYILTIIVLTGVVGRAIPPAAEGKVYEKQ